jgi:hypothetical protein
MWFYYIIIDRFSELEFSSYLWKNSIIDSNMRDTNKERKYQIDFREVHI